MTTKARRKPKGQMSKVDFENSLWGMFEELLIDGDLFSFTNHAGIDMQRVHPDQAWERFRGHYERGDEAADFQTFLKDFATWGPIASRTVELQMEARYAANT